MTLLGDRKKIILRAIIDSYIDTAEPVGSRTVARKYGIELSSATIRNEMADLEEMGFLEQPHTSAGRIPSDKGYRFYVDKLMPRRELEIYETEQIKRALESKINELGQLVSQASAVMSEITSYISMAITPQMNKSFLKTVQIVAVNYDKWLIIAVSNTGLVKNSLIKAKPNICQESLSKLSNLLNDKLAGLVLDHIDVSSLEDDIMKEISTDLDKDTINSVVMGIMDCLNQMASTELYLGGTSNIFEFPEFHNLLRAKEFLNILNTKEILYSIMNKGIENGDIKVRIGKENEMDEINDCSLVTATYSIDNEIIGSIGVIGPTRMKYSKVIASLNYIRRIINTEIINLLGENLR